jgi:hypothetical protein
MVEEANSSMIHCKSFFKCHNVPPPSTIEIIIDKGKKTGIEFQSLLVNIPCCSVSTYFLLLIWLYLLSDEAQELCSYLCKYAHKLSNYWETLFVAIVWDHYYRSLFSSYMSHISGQFSLSMGFDILPFSQGETKQ